MNYFRWILPVFFFGSILCADPVVLVTVAPYRFMVEQIAGDEVEVLLMVPTGASAHSYEPTPKEVMRTSRADLWFTIGEPFEKRAMAALQGHNPNLEIVDLRKGLDLIYDGPKGCCHGEHGADLHVWLSPRMDKVQAHTIADALIEKYPEKREHFQRGLNTLINILDDLDAEIRSYTVDAKRRLVVVAHPSYAYFCRDYNFTQLPVEFKGKDPTLKQLSSLLSQAKEADVKQVFVQKQYSNKGAKLLAEKLGATVVTLDPYGEDLRESLVNIAKHFSEADG